MKLSKRAEKLREELATQYYDQTPGFPSEKEWPALVSAKSFNQGYSAARLEAKVLEEALSKTISALRMEHCPNCTSLYLAHYDFCHFAEAIMVAEDALESIHRYGHGVMKLEAERAILNDQAREALLEDEKMKGGAE